MTQTIAIIGAGIVGVSTALHLQRRGCDVILIDKAAPAEGTSYGNGGVLAACSMVPVTGPGLIRRAPGMLLDAQQPLFMRWSYLPKLAPWLVKYLSHANAEDTARIAEAVAGIVSDSLADHQAMANGTGAEHYIVPSDYLFMYRNRAAYEADAFGWSLRRKAGFAWDELDAAAVQAYDPAFTTNIKFAAKLGNHGRISDPGAYVKALADHVVVKGGRLIQAEVRDLVRENGQVTGIRTASETIPCDAAVLCTGVWSGPLAEKLGINVPLESERGYHLELWEPSHMPRSPVMVASGKFVVTPMQGRLRLAGVVEFGGLDAPASRPPLDLLRRNIRKAMPGLTWARETEWMGHRPAPADSIPIIGQAPGIKGAWMGFGHHHIGLTGGPKTGQLLAQMITNQTPNVDVAAYSPARFARSGAK